MVLMFLNSTQIPISPTFSPQGKFYVLYSPNIEHAPGFDRYGESNTFYMYGLSFPGVVAAITVIALIQPLHGFTAKVVLKSS